MQRRGPLNPRRACQYDPTLAVSDLEASVVATRRSSIKAASSMAEEERSRRMNETDVTTVEVVEASAGSPGGAVSGSVSPVLEPSDKSEVDGSASLIANKRSSTTMEIDAFEEADRKAASEKPLCCTVL